MPVVDDYTALLAMNENNANRWNGPATLGTQVFVTYSFADGAYLPTLAEYQPYSNYGYTAFTEAQRANFRDVTAIYQAVTGVVFVEVAEGGMIDIFNTDGSSYGGWANYGYTTDTYTSDGYFVIDNSGNYDEGSYGFLSMMHELGHAMGLQHPHDGTYMLNPSLDNLAHTVMTYNNTYPYPSALGSFDLQALNHLYGDAQDTTGWSYGFVADVFTVAGASLGDVIMGVKGENDLAGRGGQDIIYGRDGADVLKGGAGRDLLIGLAGNDTIYGGKGHDLIYGHQKGTASFYDSDTLYGGGGNDRIFSGSGSDVLWGQAGNDTLSGGTSNDTLYGGLGNDTLRGGSGGDMLYGGNGDDLLSGDDADETYWGSDQLFGGSGNDRLMGRVGYDTLSGGGGNDKLFGGDQNDTLYGDGGADRLFGGNGNDTLSGGKGRDLLWGGPDRDYFDFTTDDIGWTDVIKDFEDSIDRIDLNALGVNWEDIGFDDVIGGTDTLISVAGGLKILVAGMVEADFSMADFYF